MTSARAEVANSLHALMARGSRADEHEWRPDTLQRAVRRSDRAVVARSSASHRRPACARVGARRGDTRLPEAVAALGRQDVDDDRGFTGYVLGPAVAAQRQQSSVAPAARQISCCRGPSDPSRRTSIAFGNGRRLSKDATDAAGKPSEAPRASSLGTPRTRRVTGATRTLRMTSLAASRLTIKNGRPFSSGVSPHQTSPRATTSAPTAPLGSS